LARAKSSNPGWLLDLAVIDGRRGTDSINPSVPTVAELNAPGRQSGLTAPTCPSTAVPAALLTGPLIAESLHEAVLMGLLAIFPDVRNTSGGAARPSVAGREPPAS
jgi:hypothetical protein